VLEDAFTAAPRTDTPAASACTLVGVDSRRTAKASCPAGHLRTHSRDGLGWDGRLRPYSLVVFGPADGVEYGDRVEVVAPVCDLAVLDRDDGDKVVVVGVPGADRSAVDRVFEDDD